MAALISHSPLTGIFLIRRSGMCISFNGQPVTSQSPDGDFFDPAMTKVLKLNFAGQVTVP